MNHCCTLRKELKSSTHSAEGDILPKISPSSLQGWLPLPLRWRSNCAVKFARRWQKVDVDLSTAFSHWAALHLAAGEALFQLRGTAGGSSHGLLWAEVTSVPLMWPSVLVLTCKNYHYFSTLVANIFAWHQQLFLTSWQVWRCNAVLQCNRTLDTCLKLTNPT